MSIYEKLFELFPDAQSIALAGLYGESISEFQLSDNIFIMSKREEFDNLYHPRLGPYVIKPDYYLVGISSDKRYSMPFRKLNKVSDVLSSISLAHQALCIFHNAPYSLGEVYGFLKGSHGSYGLSDPSISGRNVELDLDLFRLDTMPHSFFNRYKNEKKFDDEVKKFFEQMATEYVEGKEKKWLLAATKYTSGRCKVFAEDAILDLAVSLESLLSFDNEQIGYKLRLHLALLVGETYSERLQIREDVRKFYNFRSTVVHGSKLLLTEEKIAVVERVGKYISKALIKTCGKNIKKEVIPELEYMMLLGTPRYLSERVMVRVSELEIVDSICKFHGINNYVSYEAFFEENANPDDDNADLLIKFNFGNGKSETYPASFYLSRVVGLMQVNRFTQWLTREEEKGYCYLISYSTKPN
ncbi:hypothetical protein BBD41_27220 [Paenibacillus ihbetae]|uniref:Uncharacterized protein n=1 Tax=Paenibacillus ihbetae TaxID=1870820 RepID=A0A1B2E7N7_9BACL|nr:HEPN domain-containing protein [Paenibacillus ihbetae]ANY75969.1 hypothetical protein BBD41_27220 [Paenibacillus ihbetae]